MTHFTSTRSVLTSALIAALIAAAPGLAAQDMGIRYGVQVSLVNPMGGDSDIASLGFGASAIGEMPFTENYAIRGRVDYMIFGKKELLGIDSDVSNLCVAADGIYSLSGHDTGLFGIVSLGYANTSLKVSYAGFSASSSTSGITLGLGFGYNMTRNLGGEVKYIKGGGDSITFLQVSGTYRF